MLDQTIIDQYDALIFDMDGTLIDTMLAPRQGVGKGGRSVRLPNQSKANVRTEWLNHFCDCPRNNATLQYPRALF